MSLLETLKSEAYQSLFLKHFMFDNGRFIDNPEQSKVDFFFHEQDDESLCHDQILAEGYAFFECDQGIYLVFNDIVLYCNSESDLIPIGDNALNFTFPLAEVDNIFDVYKVIEYETFLKSVQQVFGPLSLDVQQDKIDELESKYMIG
ncbi:hypothetical protein [Vibrio owensii]|uniref:hypothetical protein n=1 Tax=Vibrio owensii TaxID=696485 RepID=UPI003CC6B946